MSKKNVKRKFNRDSRFQEDKKKRDDEIISKYKDGVKIKNLSSEYNISRQQIYTIFKERDVNLDRRRPKIVLSTKDKKDINILYKVFPMAEIARLMNVHSKNIAEIVPRYKNNLLLVEGEILFYLQDGKTQDRSAIYRNGIQRGDYCHVSIQPHLEKLMILNYITKVENKYQITKKGQKLIDDVMQVLKERRSK